MTRKSEIGKEAKRVFLGGGPLELIRLLAAVLKPACMETAGPMAPNEL
jgi:hypothetical protein